MAGSLPQPSAARKPYSRLSPRLRQRAALLGCRRWARPPLLLLLAPGKHAG
jgi:hypothetical protein